LAGRPDGTGSVDGTGSAAEIGYPWGLAVDRVGNLYVTAGNTIRKVTPTGVVTTLAGVALPPGNADGTGSAARFFSPEAIAVDAAGNVIVADTFNSAIRKITPAGVVTTVAGLAGQAGSVDGGASAARFLRPAGVAVDANGNVFVSDTGNSTIRKIVEAGVVTTFAGTLPGSADGSGNLARFNRPSGLALDGSGNLFVTDAENGTVRKITAEGVVTTLAGLAGSAGSADGTGSAARFILPTGLAVDGGGNVYVSDLETDSIRKITPAGVVTTLAGRAASPGSADGTGATARFRSPAGVAADRSGNVFVADTDNHTIRRISADGVVTTLAGSAGNYGTVDGTGNVARFNSPQGIAVDASGNVFVTSGTTIRKVTPAGVVSTVTGLV
jgi:sugar lactone lactonase YvrE